MINLNEIEREIKNLEKGKTDYNTCQKLAILYVVKDHLGGSKDPEITPVYSQKSQPDSEFLAVSFEKDPYEVLKVLDEHMDCIRALYPKEYEILMKRIRKV